MQFISAMMLVAVLFTPASPQDQSAYEWNKKSTLAVDRQVEFPGIVLEPGVYIVKLRESVEKLSIVQVLNQDETQILATLRAVPDHRMRPDNGEFTFHNVGSGPRPVQSWFFAGDLVGLEFVYPKPRAKDIAQQSNDHVMASNDIRDGLIIAVTPNGKEVVVDEVTQTARRKPQ
jgi:hypothetical protein